MQPHVTSHYFSRSIHRFVFEKAKPSARRLLLVSQHKCDSCIGVTIIDTLSCFLHLCRIRSCVYIAFQNIHCFCTIGLDLGRVCVCAAEMSWVWATTNASYFSGEHWLGGFRYRNQTVRTQDYETLTHCHIHFDFKKKCSLTSKKLQPLFFPFWKDFCSWTNPC